MILSQRTAFRSQATVLLALFFYPVSCLLSPVRCGWAAAYTEPFFVTVERVELKNAEGVWVKIIEPDRRFDLLTEEPIVQFFNNTGRIPSGVYTNVRVVALMDDHPHLVLFSKMNDFDLPLAIAKGSFVRVQFYFDLASGSRVLDERSVYKVRVTVDEDERTEPGSSFLFASSH